MAASLSATLCALVDTNVSLDLLLEREPWLSQARPLWDARDAGNLFVFLPASVLTDIFYICRKQVGFNRAKQAVQACMQGFAIIAVDRSIVAAALALPGDDFEDNVQIACAQKDACVVNAYPTTVIAGGRLRGDLQINGPKDYTLRRSAE